MCRKIWLNFWAQLTVKWARWMHKSPGIQLMASVPCLITFLGFIDSIPFLWWTAVACTPAPVLAAAHWVHPTTWCTSIACITPPFHSFTSSSAELLEDELVFIKVYSRLQSCHKSELVDYRFYWFRVKILTNQCSRSAHKFVQVQRSLAAKCSAVLQPSEYYQVLV